MARTKQASLVTVSFATVTDAVKKDMVAVYEAIVTGLKNGSTTVIPLVSGHFDGLSGRSFRARPVGLSIPGVYDKLRNLTLDSSVKACSKLDVYDTAWNTVPEAVALLKASSKGDVERMLSSVKSTNEDAYADLAEYISANTGSTLNWEEVA